MTQQSTDTSSLPAQGTWGAVPRAFWIGGGLLAIVTAGLAGALITRSGQTTAPAAPLAAAMPDAGQAGRAVPPSTLAPLSALPMAPNDGGPPAPQARAPEPAPRAVPAPARPPVVAARSNAPVRATQPAVCTTCGVVESSAAVRRKGEGTGLGAVTGGVLGGVVGNQVGGGNGKTAMTVLGAIGGGFAGNEVEKRARGETVYEVRVRMDNGNVRTFERSEAMPVGTPVTVNGSTLRVGSRGG